MATTLWTYTWTHTHTQGPTNARMYLYHASTSHGSNVFFNPWIMHYWTTKCFDTVHQTYISHEVKNGVFFHFLTDTEVFCVFHNYTSWILVHQNARIVAKVKSILSCRRFRMSLNHRFAYHIWILWKFWIRILWNCLFTSSVEKLLPFEKKWKELSAKICNDVIKWNALARLANTTLIDDMFYFRYRKTFEEKGKAFRE